MNSIRVLFYFFKLKTTEKKKSNRPPPVIKQFCLRVYCLEHSYVASYPLSCITCLLFGAQLCRKLSPYLYYMSTVWSTAMSQAIPVAVLHVCCLEHSYVASYPLSCITYLILPV